MAAAQGRPPGWVESIHGTELWALLMAAINTDPFTRLFGDCLSVVQGAKRGPQWAQAPHRKLARAWMPLAAALDGYEDRCIWVPAHTSASDVGVRIKGDGTVLSELDRSMNEYVDTLAKQEAKQDRVCEGRRKAVMSRAERLTAIATWLGTCTVAANAWPQPRGRNSQEFGSCLVPPAPASTEVQTRRENGSKLRDSQPAARTPNRRYRHRGQQHEARKPKGASAAVKAHLPTTCRRRPDCRVMRSPAATHPGRMPHTRVPAASGGRGRKHPIATLDQLPHCERWAAVRARVIAKSSG